MTAISVERTWKGDLAELLIYNQTLDQADVEYIEGYLAHKWDLNGSLDNAHPFKSTPPFIGVGQPFVYGDNELIEPYQFTFHHHLPAYFEESLISRWSFNESNLDEFETVRMTWVRPKMMDS